jgi:hypothetical protein
VAEKTKEQLFDDWKEFKKTADFTPGPRLAGNLKTQIEILRSLSALKIDAIPGEPVPVQAMIQWKTGLLATAG